MTRDAGRWSHLRFPRTWPTYAFCAAMIVLYSSDFAGLPPGYPYVSFALAPIFGLVFLWQLVRVPHHWRQCRWGGLLPAALCLASVPVADVASRWLFHARLVLHRARYEAVAARVRDGTYSPPTDEVSRSRARDRVQQEPQAPQGPMVQERVQGPNEWMHPEDRALGYWASPVWEDGNVVAVKFAVVNHGLGNVVGFVRVYEARRPRHSRGSIAPGWYAVDAVSSVAW